MLLEKKSAIVVHTKANRVISELNEMLKEYHSWCDFPLVNDAILDAVEEERLKRKFLASCFELADELIFLVPTTGMLQPIVEWMADEAEIRGKRILWIWQERHEGGLVPSGLAQILIAQVGAWQGGEILRAAQGANDAHFYSNGDPIPERVIPKARCG